MRDSFASSWFLGGCLLWVLFAFGYDMPAGALSARRARVPRRRPVASTGARRRRACVERSGVALPCLCGGSFLGLVFREGEGATFSLGRSVAPPLLVCKKRRVFIRLNRHVRYYYYYVITPGSGCGPGGHSSPLQVVSVQAALFRRVPGIFSLSRAALELHDPYR